MTAPVQPTVLSIGVAGLPAKFSTLEMYTASSLREAIATIRLVGIDLVLAGTSHPRLDIWDVIERVLAAWPHQRWILASSELTAEDEILARSLGAMMVLGAVPQEQWLSECIASLGRRRKTTRTATLSVVYPLVGAKPPPSPALAAYAAQPP